MVHFVEAVLMIWPGIVLKALSLESYTVVYVNPETRIGTDINFCSMLGPQNDYSSITISKRNSNLTKAWIGAFVNYTQWMEYQGCMSFKENVNPSPNSYKKSSTLFHCYERCKNVSFNYDYIGMQHDAYYCLAENDIEESTQCSGTSCGDNPVFLCSNSSSVAEPNRDVVLYALKDTSNINSSQLGSCGIFRFNKSNIDKGSELCDNYAYSVSYDTSNNTYISNSSQEKTWLESMNWCLLNGSKPSSLSDFVNRKQTLTENDYWTTSIRGSNLILFSDDNKLVGDKFCAAADIKDGNITKVFAEYCSKLLPVLCKGSMPPGSNKPGVDIERNMTSINVERNDIDNESSLTFPQIIGSSVGVIMVICLIICAICMYRRKKSKSSKTPNQSISLTVTENDKTNNAYYATAFQGGPSPQEKKTDDGYVSKEGDENFYDQNAFVTERNTLGSEYDTMADIRANTEGIYDETRTTPSKPLTEDVYDISFKARMNQENTYDVTSPSNNQNNSEIYDTSVIV